MAPNREQIALLDRFLAVDAKDALPLYAQVERGLRRLIQTEFEDGQRFYTEELLSQHLGVSVGTIRRALGGLTTEGLLERHVPAGTFVRRRLAPGGGAFTINVFLSTFESYFDRAILTQLFAICGRREFRLEVFHTFEGENIIEMLGKAPAQPGRSGFVLLSTGEASSWRLHELLDQRGLPSVIIDRLIPEWPGAYVGIDNAQAIRLGLEHLCSMGHERIALLVTEERDHPNVHERIRAFESFAREQQLAEAPVVYSDLANGDPAGGTLEELYAHNVSKDVVARLLETSAPPTAVFALSDIGAWALLKRLAERGVRVPHDLSVLGFGNEAMSTLVHPGLSTVGQPYKDITERAVEALIAPAQPAPRELLPAHLVLRESTAHRA